jgi:hypothetical protein
MKNIQREDILIISRHASLTKEGIDKVLKDIIYSNK